MEKSLENSSSFELSMEEENFLKEEIRKEQVQQDKELWSVFKDKNMKKVFEKYLNLKKKSSEAEQSWNSLQMYIDIKKLQKSMLFSGKKAKKIMRKYLTENATNKVDIDVQLDTKMPSRKMFDETLFKVVDLLHLRLDHFKASYEYRNYISSLKNQTMSDKLKKMMEL